MSKKEKKRNQTCSFPVEKYLVQFEQLVQSQTLYVCPRERKCVCSDKEFCTCDDDCYFAIEVRQCEIASNCKYIFEFRTRPALAKSFESSHHVLRIFSMDGDCETPIADIDTKSGEFIICGIKPVTRFWAQDITRQAPTEDYFGFTVCFDYMSFNNEASPEVGAKNEKPSF